MDHFNLIKFPKWAPSIVLEALIRNQKMTNIQHLNDMKNLYTTDNRLKLYNW